MHEKVKHPVDLKAVIFDFDKTLSEHDVYEGDWSENN
jgi:hypothetical protein